MASYQINNPLPQAFPARLSHSTLASSADQWAGVATAHLVQDPFVWDSEYETAFCGIRRQLIGSTPYDLRAGGRRSSATLTPGSLNIYPANMPTWSRMDEVVTVQHVYLTRPFMKRLADEVTKGDPSHTALQFQFNIRDTMLEVFCQALLDEVHSPHPMGQLYAQSIGCVIGLHLLRHYSSAQLQTLPKKHGLTAAQLKLIRAYMDAHLASNIGLEDLAGLVGLGIAQFSRRFFIATGKTPHQYVIDWRLDRAKHLLTFETLSVTEVAHQVGFSDHSHLIRHFKRRFGVTPTSWLHSSLHAVNVHKHD
jgi:AraC family transcriptional regulator